MRAEAGDLRTTSFFYYYFILLFLLLLLYLLFHEPGLLGLDVPEWVVLVLCWEKRKRENMGHGLSEVKYCIHLFTHSFTPGG